ncbi:hypothetical protein [Streptomyces sp. NPDC087437]|uniref:hypothetical protein n=1 Tax=Streptomyces sp. NPDC087437 TaxID=3365789 RepID=UPI00381B6BE8
MGARFSGVALEPRRALIALLARVTLQALKASFSLRAGFARITGVALRPCGPLGTGLALRAGFPLRASGVAGIALRACRSFGPGFSRGSLFAGGARRPGFAWITLGPCHSFGARFSGRTGRPRFSRGTRLAGLARVTLRSSRLARVTLRPRGPGRAGHPQVRAARHRDRGELVEVDGVPVGRQLHLVQRAGRVLEALVDQAGPPGGQQPVGGPDERDGEVPVVVQVDPDGTGDLLVRGRRQQPRRPRGQDDLAPKRLLGAGVAVGAGDGEDVHSGLLAGPWA